MTTLPARSRRRSHLLAAVVCTASAGALSACGGPAPAEPAGVTPGVFVAVTVPRSVYHGASGYVEATADTLHLDAAGTARQTVVLRTVSYGGSAAGPGSLGPAGTSEVASRYAGVWQAAGAALQVIVTAPAGGPTWADTLRLRVGREGDLWTAAGERRYARR